MREHGTPMAPEELEAALAAAADGRIVTDLGGGDALAEVLEAIARDGMTPEREAAARRAFAEELAP